MHTRVSSVWIYAGEAPAPATPEPATSEPAADAGAPKETDAAADARGRLVGCLWLLGNENLLIYNQLYLSSLHRPPASPAREAPYAFSCREDGRVSVVLIHAFTRARTHTHTHERTHALSVHISQTHILITHGSAEKRRSAQKRQIQQKAARHNIKAQQVSIVDVFRLRGAKCHKVGVLIRIRSGPSQDGVGSQKEGDGSTCEGL